MSNRSRPTPHSWTHSDAAARVHGRPILTDFETAARVRYAGPNRGPGRARAGGTVLEAQSHPDQPNALRVSVLWDDQDDPRPYTVTADTLHLWTLLPPPRIYLPNHHHEATP